MDDTRADAQDEPGTRTTMGRRTFFGRTLLAAGAAAGLMALTGCPGGEQDDDEDDEDDD